MIPILYPPEETSFSSNGLGRLSEALACTVEEERNGKYELEMLYPVSGGRFGDIRNDCIIMAAPADAAQEQPFRIYKVSKPMGGKIRIQAEHISYQLSHIPVSPFTASSAPEALLGLKTHSAEECPFEFWTDVTAAANFKMDQPSSIRSVLGGVRGSVLDTYGGEYEFDGYTVRLHSERGMDRGVVLRYGKNITDIRQDENIQNTITGVYPFCKSTGENGVENVVELPEKVLHSQNAGNFAYQRTVPLDLSSDFGETAPTEKQLRDRAAAYMKANGIGVPSVSIKVSFVPLWQTEEYKEAANLERVRLCDRVTVKFPTLGISAQAKVVRTKYNVLLGRYEEIELGDARSSLGATIRGAIADTAEASAEGIRGAKSELRKAIDHATDLITGGLGGYVVFGRNADGEPEEILILDKPTVEQAVNIIRLNKNGLGFSKNGIGGPYENAWTIDGNLVADFITTGTLTAVLIKAGILSDTKGKNFWNMETGEFQLASTAKVGGKTVDKIASDAVDAYDDSVTQQMVFNRLTNNGETQGIYLKDKKLYINASYIATGVLADPKNNTKFNLETGELTMKKGSIDIGGGKFKVSTSGDLTAKSAAIEGTIKSGSSSGYWVNLNSNGEMTGGYGSSQYGFVDFAAKCEDLDTGEVYSGVQIQGGCLRISTRIITVARSTSTSTTSTHGGNGTLRYVESIVDNGDGTITWTNSTVKFINGIMVSEL